MTTAPRPRDFDLDDILEGPENARRHRARRRRLRWGLLGLALIAAVSLLWRVFFAPVETRYPNLAPRQGLGAELSDLIDANGDWVGTVDPGWAGAESPGQAARACLDLARRAGVPPGAILSLVTASGLPLTSCEVPAQ